MTEIDIVTPPTVEPVTLEEMRTHLRTVDTDEDTDIAAYVSAARKLIENETGRCLPLQTMRQTIDAFPAGEIHLMRAPVVAVTAVSYVDVAGVEQTLASNLYRVVASESGGRVAPAWGRSWPSIGAGVIGAVRVTYTAGYATVPADLKAAVKLLAAQYFEFREAVAAGLNVAELPNAVRAIINANRTHWSW